MEAPTRKSGNDPSKRSFINDIYKISVAKKILDGLLTSQVMTDSAKKTIEEHLEYSNELAVSYTNKLKTFKIDFLEELMYGPAIYIYGILIKTVLDIGKPEGNTGFKRGLNVMKHLCEVLYCIESNVCILLGYQYMFMALIVLLRALYQYAHAHFESFSLEVDIITYIFLCLMGLVLFCIVFQALNCIIGIVKAVYRNDSINGKKARLSMCLLGLIITSSVSIWIAYALLFSLFNPGSFDVAFILYSFIAAIFLILGTCMSEAGINKLFKPWRRQLNIIIRVPLTLIVFVLALAVIAFQLLHGLSGNAIPIPH
ncbi:hypothetical protein NEOKW01_0126 [Nematocida sp. AWRm80]|nr:hypothetical protein NEOKW01_0126 [Nematocida sp. AWRm80]